MGGWGSGGYSSRDTVDSCLTINLFKLRKDRCLVHGRPGSLTWRRCSDGTVVGSISYVYWEDRLELSFNVNGEPVRQAIRFASTPCHFGGERQWLRCPGCGRRAATLHIKAKHFFCRHCNDLAYQVQREEDWDRAIRAEERVLRKLGVDRAPMPNGWFFPPSRPKGMHRRTYERLCEQAERAHRRHTQAYHRRLIKLLGCCG
ncbi:MAG: hypothetical protein ACR2QJ_10835 [Geminicoccaceae bacterium]